MSWLTDPFATAFMRRALVMTIIVGIASPLVGTWLVLRRMSYLGDAMGHATLAGVAVAFAAGTSVLVGALGAGVVVATLLLALSTNRRLNLDAVIGVVSSTMFAIGVIVIGRLDTGRELGHFLFGQLLAVTRADIRLGAVVLALALAVVVGLFPELRMASFDPVHARQVGVRVAAIQFLLLILLAAAVVISLRTVGTLMSVSMLITPAATARLTTSTARSMSIVAIGLGLVGSVTGLILQYHLDSPPGATIALVVNGIFAIVFVATMPRRMRHHVRPTS